MSLLREYKAEYLQKDSLAGRDQKLIQGVENGEIRTFLDRYPVKLQNGDYLVLPIVPFPDGEKAISLLMSTACNFEVIIQLGVQLTRQVKNLNPEVIAGIPTLGLEWAQIVAKNLHHPNYVSLSFTEKFWFDPNLSVETSSITSGAGKRLHFDPMLKNRVEDKRVVIVDDVVCTGGSLVPAAKLVEMAGGRIVGAGVVLTEGHDWEGALTETDLSVSELVFVGHIPMFEKNEAGLWAPIPSTT